MYPTLPPRLWIRIVSDERLVFYESVTTSADVIFLPLLARGKSTTTSPVGMRKPPPKMDVRTVDVDNFQSQKNSLGDQSFLYSRFFVQCCFFGFSISWQAICPVSEGGRTQAVRPEGIYGGSRQGSGRPEGQGEQRCRCCCQRRCGLIRAGSRNLSCRSA